MKIQHLLCRVAERQESWQMDQIVCPILLVCNSGSHHKMSISLIFLTSVHQVRRYENWRQRLVVAFLDLINLPRYKHFQYIRLRKHFDHILRRGVEKNIICFCMTCSQPEIVCDGENINPSLACTLTFFRREHSKMIFSHFFLTELNQPTLNWNSL